MQLYAFHLFHYLRRQMVSRFVQKQDLRFAGYGDGRPKVSLLPYQRGLWMAGEILRSKKSRLRQLRPCLRHKR